MTNEEKLIQQLADIQEIRAAELAGARKLAERYAYDRETLERLENLFKAVGPDLVEAVELLREQLAAVTKERDDAREMLAKHDEDGDFWHREWAEHVTANKAMRSRMEALAARWELEASDMRCAMQGNPAALEGRVDDLREALAASTQPPADSSDALAEKPREPIHYAHEPEGPPTARAVFRLRSLWSEFRREECAVCPEDKIMDIVRILEAGTQPPDDPETLDVPPGALEAMDAGADAAAARARADFDGEPPHDSAPTPPGPAYEWDSPATRKWPDVARKVRLAKLRDKVDAAREALAAPTTISKAGSGEQQATTPTSESLSVRVDHRVPCGVADNDACARETSPTAPAPAEESCVRIAQWTREYGPALKPPHADTYGEGMRDAKRQVAAILAQQPAPSTPQAVRDESRELEYGDDPLLDLLCDAQDYLEGNNTNLHRSLPAFDPDPYIEALEWADDAEHSAALPSPQAVRDESKPPPGWYPYKSDGQWAGWSRNAMSVGTLRSAWAQHDAEHSAATPSIPPLPAGWTVEGREACHDTDGIHIQIIDGGVQWRFNGVWGSGTLRVPADVLRALLARQGGAT